MNNKKKINIKVIGLELGGYEVLNKMKNGIEGVDIVECCKYYDKSNFHEVNSVKVINNFKDIDAVTKNTDICIIVCKHDAFYDDLYANIISKEYLSFLRSAKKNNSLTIGVYVPDYKYKTNKKDEIIKKSNRIADMTLILPKEKYLNKSFENGLKAENEEILNFIKTIKDLFIGTGLINISLDDYKKILRGSGNSYIEVCESSGDNKELKAAKHILKSFKKYNDLNKVKSVFICLSSKDVSFNNTNIVCEYIKKSLNEETNCIYLTVQDDSLINKVQLSVIINE